MPPLLAGDALRPVGTGDAVNNVRAETSDEYGPFSPGLCALTRKKYVDSGRSGEIVAAVPITSLLSLSEKVPEVALHCSR